MRLQVTQDLPFFPAFGHVLFHQAMFSLVLNGMVIPVAEKVKYLSKLIIQIHPWLSEIFWKLQ